MFRGRQVFNFSLILNLLWSLSLNPSVSNAGPYGFGMKWSGAFNPYRMGGVTTFQTGFTTGLGIPGQGYNDGVFYTAYSVANDSSGSVYVVDQTLHRILKYSSAGVYQGWIGKIAASPTGGAAGCNGAAIGTVTPGWCTGGFSGWGTEDGALMSPESLAVDSSGNIYVTDQNFRISKFNSSGVFQGWIGKIAASPTGGAAGCNGASVGSQTPGWCTGGSAAYDYNDGGLTVNPGIAIDASGNIIVVDNLSHRAVKFNSSGVYQGWIGNISVSPTGGAAGCNGAAVGTATPGWCTGGSATSGSSDGMLDTPTDISFDASGNFYVTEYSNHRIQKFHSSGVSQGWVGKIGASPTGGAAGCNGASVGTVTPGWCKGGTAASGSGDGMLNFPRTMAIASSGNIYINSGSGRILKFNSAGVFQGWIGNIAVSPTGGAAGCNGATTGTLTPGWCLGGVAGAGTGDGMITDTTGISVDGSENIFVVDTYNRINKYTSAGVASGALQSKTTFQTWNRSSQIPSAGQEDGQFGSPYGIDVDSAGNILVADSLLGRVSKFSASGTFLGWIGGIQKSPTGGDAGCTAAAPGSRTPGWCTGGLAAPGDGDGQMSQPMDLALDSSGNIYIVDQNNSRIMKFNSAGVFQGWIGKILTSPTGGAAGCNGAAVGTVTPGWCTGGTSTSGDGNGMLQYPFGIAIDSANNLYVTDSINSRIVKYNSAGVFQGWIGQIATSPTGGAAGCNGASVGSITPGWCTGGTANNSSVAGAFDYPSSVALDSSGNLYILDSDKQNISKWNSSGAFQGWIGAIGVSPTGGAAGCNGAAVGTVTPGWCTGGESTDGSGDGAFYQPVGLGIDSKGNLYIGDWDDYRVSKFNSSGVFQGWIGVIGSSPTGGGTGCKGAAANTFTPGWCKGGSASVNTYTGDILCTTAIAWSKTGDLYISTCLSTVHRISTQGR